MLQFPDMVAEFAPAFIGGLVGRAPLLYVPAAVVGGLDGLLIILLNLRQAHNHLLLHFFLALRHTVNIYASGAAEASGVLGNLY